MAYKIPSILITGATSLLLSCGDSNSNSVRNVELPTVSQQEETLPNVYGIKGEGIEIRTGPGEKHNKVINKKTSEILKKTVYATVDYSVKVQEQETKKGWSKVVVVDPDYLSESHRGWIKTKYIIKGDEQNTSALSDRKIKIFNDVTEVQKALRKNGIGNLRPWRKDEIGWLSGTEYFQFGSTSTENGMKNNLAYYLDSDDQSSVKSLKLVLNINNKVERRQALQQFRTVAEKTFTSLGIEIPKRLLNAITKQENFKSENNFFTTSLKLDKSKIDTWELTIETK